jgi:hypothetical protein
MIKCANRESKRNKTLYVLGVGECSTFRQMVIDAFGVTKTFILVVPHSQVALYTWTGRLEHRARQIGEFNAWDRILFSIQGDCFVISKRVTQENEVVREAIPAGTRSHAKHTVTRNSDSNVQLNLFNDNNWEKLT